MEQAKPFADLLLTCTSVIAIIVGGWWTYNNFIAEDTHEADPNISVSAEVQPYDATRALLVVHVKPVNHGKVPIELDGGEQGDIDVTIKEIPPGLGNGHIEQDKLVAVPNATARNIVSRYKGYVLEPGTEYDEIESFVVPRGKMYLVTAEMDHYDTDPDVEVDGSTVVRIEP